MNITNCNQISFNILTCQKNELRNILIIFLLNVELNSPPKKITF